MANIKRCSGCGIEKPWSEYTMRTRGNSVRPIPKCRPCQQIANQKSNERHAERRAKYSANWYQKHKARIDQRQKEYRAANADKVVKWRQTAADKYDPQKNREYNRRWRAGKGQNYEKRRRQQDPLFRMAADLRTRLSKIFKKQGVIKPKTEDMFGCSLQHLREHLVGTAIRNYGVFELGVDYHIDHVIPLASATSVEDLIRLNHYSNLQLLTAADNLKKGARLSTPEIHLIMEC